MCSSQGRALATGIPQAGGQIGVSTLDVLARFSLKDKTAVVTGAAGLLGRHHCLALAAAGATVVAADREQGVCQALVEEIGGGAFAFAADVTDQAAVRKLLGAAVRRTGRVDILVNNAAIDDKFQRPPAGAPDRSRFENYPLDNWNQSLAVNATGVFICAQVIGAKMAEMGGGSIINIGSTYGIVAPDQSLYTGADGEQHFFKSAAYPTTKGAVIAFTRFLAAYWGKAGVRVNTLTPGGIENAQDPVFITEYARRTPLGRMASPDDYAGALVFLASDASSYMTGANLVVDGGFTIW